MATARAACAKAAALLQQDSADVQLLSQRARAARCAGDAAAAASAEAQLSKLQYQQVRYIPALARNFNQKETP